MMRTLCLFLFLLLSACAQQQAEYHDVKGNRYQQQDFQGKWIVINYWAGWCPSCYREVAEFNRLHREMNKSKVMVIGINYDRSEREQLLPLIEKFNIQYPVMLQDVGQSFNVKPISGLPTTVIINPQGQITKVLLGEQTQQSLLGAMQIYVKKDVS